MRISDWSSDVCSSDLAVCLGALGRCGRVAGLCLAAGRFSPGFAVGGRRPAAGAGYDWRDLDQFHAAARRLWLGNTGAADSVHGVYGHGDHRFATEPVMNVSPVELIEVGPRDGLQNESVPVDTATKLELIQRLLDRSEEHTSELQSLMRIS